MLVADTKRVCRTARPGTSRGGVDCGLRLMRSHLCGYRSREGQSERDCRVGDEAGAAQLGPGREQHIGGGPRSVACLRAAAHRVNEPVERDAPCEEDLAIAVEVDRIR